MARQLPEPPVLVAARQSHLHAAGPGLLEHPKDKDKPTSTSRRARYTPADDAKIRQLKEQGLSWIAIAKHFPGRSAGAIEVRYHTKLKTADPSRSWSRQWSDHSRALSPVVGDDGGEEEFPVEEICGDRGLPGGGVKLLVRWEGGEET